MARNIEIDPRIGNDRVGLMITRGQIEHLGHTALKAQMLVDNSYNIIGFGSSQKQREFGNPLTPDQKRRAQLGAWGDLFKMVFLQDIGATDRSDDWADYVMDRINSNQLPAPTDFYAGSTHEARWYESHFTRTLGEATYQRGLFKVWEDPVTGKRIHILDRKANYTISSSEVRTLIERRDPAWKDMVPARLWNFYDWEYPPELRDAIDLKGEPWPDLSQYPVSTKGISKEDPDHVYLLRADGKWRSRTSADDAKSLGD